MRIAQGDDEEEIVEGGEWIQMKFKIKFKEKTYRKVAEARSNGEKYQILVQPVYVLAP